MAESNKKSTVQDITYSKNFELFRQYVVERSNEDQRQLHDKIMEKIKEQMTDPTFIQVLTEHHKEHMKGGFLKSKDTMLEKALTSLYHYNYSRVTTPAMAETIIKDSQFKDFIKTEAESLNKGDKNFSTDVATKEAERLQLEVVELRKVTKDLSVKLDKVNRALGTLVGNLKNSLNWTEEKINEWMVNKQPVAEKEVSIDIKYSNSPTAITKDEFNVIKSTLESGKDTSVIADPKWKELIENTGVHINDRFPTLTKEGVTYKIIDQLNTMVISDGHHSVSVKDVKVPESVYDSKLSNAYGKSGSYGNHLDHRGDDRFIASVTVAEKPEKNIAEFYEYKIFKNAKTNTLSTAQVYHQPNERVGSTYKVTEEKLLPHKDLDDLKKHLNTTISANMDLVIHFNQAVTKGIGPEEKKLANVNALHTELDKLPLKGPAAKKDHQIEM